jgi:hypothetical protein
MSKRGPKIRTGTNSRKEVKGFIRRASLDPPSELNEAATVEYWRLIGVLDSRGTLDRIDLAAVAQAARVKEQLDRVSAEADAVLEADTVQMLHMLVSQWRGLCRDMGLTLMPSRSLVRTIAKGAVEPSKWGDKLKVHGA